MKLTNNTINKRNTFVNIIVGIQQYDKLIFRNQLISLKLA